MDLKQIFNIFYLIVFLGGVTILGMLWLVSILVP